MKIKAHWILSPRAKLYKSCLSKVTHCKLQCDSKDQLKIKMHVEWPPTTQIIIIITFHRICSNFELPQICKIFKLICLKCKNMVSDKAKICVCTPANDSNITSLIALRCTLHRNRLSTIYGARVRDLITNRTSLIKALEHERIHLIAFQSA